jgi:hypothetical protein
MHAAIIGVGIIGFDTARRLAGIVGADGGTGQKTGACAAAAPNPALPPAAPKMAPSAAPPKVPPTVPRVCSLRAASPGVV